MGSAPLETSSGSAPAADAEKLARRDIIRREETYRQLVGRRTAVSYAEGVLTYQQAAGSYSTAITQRYQTENFQVHLSDRLPFPLEFRNHNAVLENHSGRQWLKWFCEAGGGSSDEAMLEQTPYPFKPH